MLKEDEKYRYERHLMLEEVGEEGQEKLFNSSVLIIGAGGLGSPNAFYLSAAGVGRIGIIDFDKVDLSNLQRQILHNTNDVGKYKVDSALQKLSQINNRTKFEIFYEKVNEENIYNFLQNYSFVIDATDNLDAKFLINDACMKANKPLSHAGIYKFSGQILTILPHKSACLSCLYPLKPNENLNPQFRAGLFGVLPGVIGSIQASEAIKYFLNIGDLLTNRMLHIDVKTMNFKILKIAKNKNCKFCGNES